jgi:hypothetical protein
VPAEALRATTSFSLGSDFPDRFYLWHNQGEATLTIGPEQLPHHHLDPTIRSVSVQLLGGGALPLTLGAPGGASAAVTADTAGRVPSSDPALAALVGADVRGDWALATTATDRSAVDNVLLFVEYDFTARGVA